MKKRFKGLIALILAMTMVVSTATSAFAAISDERYEQLSEGQFYMTIISDANFDAEKEFEKYGRFGLSNYYGNSAVLGNKPADVINANNKYYSAGGFTIWEVKEDGCVYEDSKSKKVDADYIVTEADIKEYGYSMEGASTYFPCIVADLVPKNLTLDVYDETGTTKVSEITYNIESDKGTDKLEIPEGYCGYMLYSEYEYTTTENVYDDNWNIIDTIEHTVVKKNDVFISSYADLVREIELTEQFNYEFKKLVPTKKMPYKIHYSEQSYDFSYQQPYYDNTGTVVWLEPGEKIIDNPEVKEVLSHREYSDDIEWTVWTIWYCGSAVQTYPDSVTTSLSVEDYSTVRDPYNMGIYYYEENYPILSTYAPCTYYDIPYYEMDGTRGEDFSVSKSMLSWGYNCECGENSECECEEYSCNCEFLKRYFEYEYGNGTCPDAWKFIYDGHDYGEVSQLSTIWDIAIADGKYDPAKAKLMAVCKNHDYDYANGEIVINPTVNEKGTTEYECKKCGSKTRVEDVDKLNQIDSVILSNNTYTYDGSEFKPTVTVKAYVDSQLVTLTQDDYTVSYSNNKNAGTATVTVTGKGNYGGTKTATFKINPAELTSFDLDVKTVYTGKPIKGTIVVKAGTTKLSEGKDYTVSYKNNKEIGVATVTVIGKGNYSGKLEKTFTIKPEKVTGLKQSGYATGTITLKWNKVAGATKYQVFKKNTSTGEVESVGITKTNSYTVKKLKAGSKYTFAVRAYTEINRAKIYGDVSSTKTMITKTAATRITVKSNARRKATITWNRVTGADGYEVYMTAKKGGEYKKIMTVSKNITRYTKSGLISRRVHYFKVRSFKYNANGNKVYSAFSRVDSVRIK